MQQLRKMYPDGGGAQSISGCDNRRKAAVQRKMQQHGGKQAQDRKAKEDDHFRQLRISRGCNQGSDGADIPEEREAGGGKRQPASAQAGTRAVPQEQVKKNAENDGSAGVTDGVNELGLVES